MPFKLKTVFTRDTRLLRLDDYPERAADDTRYRWYASWNPMRGKFPPELERKLNIVAARYLLRALGALGAVAGTVAVTLAIVLWLGLRGGVAVLLLLGPLVPVALGLALWADSRRVRDCLEYRFICPHCHHILFTGNRYYEPILRSGSCPSCRQSFVVDPAEAARLQKKRGRWTKIALAGALGLGALLLLGYRGYAPGYNTFPSRGWLWGTFLALFVAVVFLYRPGGSGAPRLFKKALVSIAAVPIGFVIAFTALGWANSLADSVPFAGGAQALSLRYETKSRSGGKQIAKIRVADPRLGARTELISLPAEAARGLQPGNWVCYRGRHGIFGVILDEVWIPGTDRACPPEQD